MSKLDSSSPLLPIYRPWDRLSDQYWREHYHLFLDNGYTLRPHFKPSGLPPREQSVPTFLSRPLVCEF